jgi:hypothetical protein
MATLFTRHWKLVILWGISLVATGAMLSAAQAPRPSGRPGLLPGFVLENPTVISGNDVGFRIERTQDGIPVGRIVVRVEGQWVDTAGPSPLPAR